MRDKLSIFLVAFIMLLAGIGLVYSAGMGPGMGWRIGPGNGPYYMGNATCFINEICCAQGLCWQRAICMENGMYCAEGYCWSNKTYGSMQLMAGKNGQVQPGPKGIHEPGMGLAQ